MTKLETEYLKQMGIEPENYVQPMTEIVPLAPRKVKAMRLPRSHSTNSS